MTNSLVQLLKVYASEDGPLMSAGKPRWKRGEALQLRVSRGTVWVCRAGISVGLGETWQSSGGLLYTYAAEDWVEVDGERVNGRD